MNPWLDENAITNEQLQNRLNTQARAAQQIVNDPPPKSINEVKKWLTDNKVKFTQKDNTLLVTF